MVYTTNIDESLEIIKQAVKGKEDNTTLSFSHQNEDIIILDFLEILDIKCEVFTLDTHKLFKESKEYEEAVNKHFEINIKNYSAPKQEILDLETKLGEYGIFDSIENRKECCRVRKLVPLKEALSGKNIWLTGLRATQSVTRQDFKIQEHDDTFNILKVSPLLKWSAQEIKDYMKMRKLPMNTLYSNGYASIGCVPCTRAIQKGEDERAGRWWWENPEHKECGLHKR